jgi:hypothetical protein
MDAHMSRLLQNRCADIPGSEAVRDRGCRRDRSQQIEHVCICDKKSASPEGYDGGERAARLRFIAD